MQIQLLYFAGLREALGLDRETVTLPPEVVDTGALRAWLASRAGTWAEQFAPQRALRAAVNQEMVRKEKALSPGDEVAFFPPVTGG
jgi:sulfur-carrier protein